MPGPFLWGLMGFLPVSKAVPQKIFLEFQFSFSQNIIDSDIEFISHKKVHFLIGDQDSDYRKKGASLLSLILCMKKKILSEKNVLVAQSCPTL